MTVINLNKYRKQRRRAQDERRSAENRVRFGTSRSLHLRTLREREQMEKRLDSKRLD